MVRLTVTVRCRAGTPTISRRECTQLRSTEQCSVFHHRWPSPAYRQLKIINFLHDPAKKVAQMFYKLSEDGRSPIDANFVRVHVYLENMDIEVQRSLFTPTFDCR